MEVIARRELAALSRDGERRSVEVRLGKPVPSGRQGGEWACPMQIVGLGPERIKEAFGVDSVQAIQLALRLATIDLHSLASSNAVRLEWLGGEIGFWPGA
ncbi:MAG TPA: hypothetical protein VGQ69_12890 [Gemmatimonadales bacterium]|jgi:hypothetical protein|nr:hypothetical protein [Gemmatimonadales bacterium]HEV8600254.1 hypothetical protein [Gemmatimonadales bacterium]